MQRRKDHKGRVLKSGESYRKSDGLYMYRWTAKNGKRHTVYDATLEGLREKEEKIQHDLAEGIRIPERMPIRSLRLSPICPELRKIMMP